MRTELLDSGRMLDWGCGFLDGQMDIMTAAGIPTVTDQQNNARCTRLREMATARGWKIVGGEK